ncbi:MAG: hypothetical protein M1824_000164 [Vezdaea acicularis]|nr:MAG: hypothetical protein M1824_000164 [Vezdaea acicularis]
MAEVVGTFASVLTITVLFKACVNAFDLVQAARHQEANYNRLLVKFNIEKCRLYTWGQMMRLTSTSEHDKSHPLDSFQFRGLVTQTLQTLYDLFSDTQRIQERYGCREATSLAIDSGKGETLIDSITAAFLHFQNNSHDGGEMNLRLKARWVIRDQKKFAELVLQVKELVDGLQEITKSIAPVIQQESAMTDRITAIADAETLQLVSEVCEKDHPMFSQAASLRSEILSMSDARRLEIEAWVADETSVVDPEILDLEEMSLPELKHHVFLLLKQRQQLKDEYSNMICLFTGLRYLDDDLISIMARRKLENVSGRISSVTYSLRVTLRVTALFLRQGVFRIVGAQAKAPPWVNTIHSKAQNALTGRRAWRSA